MSYLFEGCPEARPPIRMSVCSFLVNYNRDANITICESKMFEREHDFGTENDTWGFFGKDEERTRNGLFERGEESETRAFSDDLADLSRSRFRVRHHELI